MDRIFKQPMTLDYYGMHTMLRTDASRPEQTADLYTLENSPRKIAILERRFKKPRLNIPQYFSNKPAKIGTRTN